MKASHTRRMLHSDRAANIGSPRVFTRIYRAPHCEEKPSFADMSTNLLILSPSAVITAAKQHPTLTVGVLAIYAILLIVRYFQSPWRRLPPGPKGLPLLGNVLQMRTRQWLVFMKWKQQFGQRSSPKFLVIFRNDSLR
jgi:hypothetical protein